MDYITELNTGVVVDRAGLNKLKTEDMAGTLAEIYGRGKQVVIMDNVRGFFSNANLFRALEGNAEGLDMILEQRGITLTQDQLDLVTNFNNLKAYINDQIAALTPPPPPYPFTDLPEGWELEEHIKFNTNTIRRIRGRGPDYAIGIKACRNLWDWIAPFWAGNVSSLSRREHYVRAAGYSNYAEPHKNSVEIGCQTIQRYELEQVALKQGWDFPVVAGDIED